MPSVFAPLAQECRTSKKGGEDSMKIKTKVKAGMLHKAR